MKQELKRRFNEPDNFELEVLQRVPRQIVGGLCQDPVNVVSLFFLFPSLPVLSQEFKSAFETPESTSRN